MSTSILLDPALGVSAAAFAQAWNADPRLEIAARANPAPPAVSKEVFLDPALAQDLVVLLEGLLLGLATNALYDGIKAALIRQKPAAATQTVRILERTQPDGTRLLIVTVEREPPDA